MGAKVRKYGRSQHAAASCYQPVRNCISLVSFPIFGAQTQLTAFPMYWKRAGTFPQVSYAIILVLCTACSAFAQKPSYLPFADDSLALEHYLKATTLRFETDKAALSGTNKKYLVEQYQERYELLKKMYNEKEFVTNPKATAYLASVLELIVRKNSQLHALKPTALFSKVYWPNASSTGEGTLIFNISLFNRLQNEAEVAFILCHELAHLFLDHSNKAILKYVNNLYSTEIQAELRDIKKSEYQQGQRLKSLVKNFAFNNRRHSRDGELEADSLALELMKNTGYDVRESLNVLALLDSVDTEKYAHQLHLNKQMSFAAYPFQPRWVRSKSVSLGEAMAEATSGKPDEEWNKDSLKTHPDCLVRIEKLKGWVAQFYGSAQQVFLINPGYFDTLVHQFDLERIAYCYQQKQVSRALFFSLQMRASYPDEPWLATMIGKCFNILYTAQKEHYFGKYVDLPTASKENTEYDTFLQYLQSLRLDEMAAENYWFMEQHHQQFAVDAAFMKEYQEAQKNYVAAAKH
jgi:Zn-dependent protease with chaperone function